MSPPTPEKPHVWFKFRQSADLMSLTFVATGIKPDLDKCTRPALIRVQMTDFGYRVSKAVEEKCRHKLMDGKMEAMLPFLVRSIYEDMREEGSVSFVLQLAPVSFVRV